MQLCAWSYVLRALALWTFIDLGSPIKITGATSGVDATSRLRPFRREINELSKSGPSWDLYILALQRFQNDSLVDELSYFEVAGVHGYPEGPWDGVGGDGTAGFCMHSSVLFPLWHRPYLALFEQVLSYHAQTIARDYPLEVREAYETAAETLRIPYWDWAVNYALPNVTTTATLLINTPNGVEVTANPLLQYDFPVDMVASGYFPSEVTTSKYQRTVRWPNTVTQMSNQAAASNALVGNSAATVSKLYELFASVDNYTQFAAYKLADNNNNGTNLERIHGTIHNNVGCPYNLGNFNWGHMTVFPMSAFDPIFWLHHANVDRVVAIWQTLHPGSYVEPVLNRAGTYFQPPNTTDTIDTPLAPFHSDTGSTMWTAATVRDTATFGYTYPELIDWNVSASDLAVSVRQRVNELYNPDPGQLTNSTRRRRGRRNTSIAQVMGNVDGNTALDLGANNMKTQWYLKVTIEGKAAERGTTVYLFVGEPVSSMQAWSTATNLIGVHAPLIPVDQLEASVTPTQYDNVPCTHTVAAAIDKGLLSTSDSDQVVPFLARNVVVRMHDINGVEVVSGSKSGVTITILSRSIQPRESISDFPAYGAFEEHGYVQ